MDEVVTLTFTPSETEIIAGIPESVEISSNSPATIYYTLDGTLPTLLSSIYTSAITLPTDENAVTLSAVAYYVDQGVQVPSAVLSNTYYTDQSDLNRTRWIFFEGVVYSYPGGQDIPFYYDVNGDVSYEIDVDPAELDFIEPSRTRLGEEVGTDNEVTPVDPDETASLIDNEIPEFSTPNGDAPFKPSAKFILIDSRDGAEEQSVRLINGPYMSLRDSKRYFNGIDFYRLQGHNHISGSLTKIHYNRQKGVMVAYYFDSAESRWVKSISDLETPDTPPNQGQIRITNPLVFKWFNFGRQQMS